MGGAGPANAINALLQGHANIKHGAWWCMSEPGMLCWHGAAPLDAVVRGGNGREGVEAQLQVHRAPAQVVHDADRVAARRQVQRSRPPAIPIPACAPTLIPQTPE